MSIEWTGFLLPTYSESYTFELHANDGVRLWVDQKLILDKFSDLATDTSSNPAKASTVITLTAGKFVPIKVQFYESIDLAFISLSW